MSIPLSFILALVLAVALIMAMLLDLKLLRDLRAANRRADSIARALRVMTDKLDFQTHHDTLTGLSNGAHFEAMLDATLQVRDSQPPGATDCNSLLYFDLDQFKAINDACGHAAGDELVKQVAWRLRQLVRSGDTLARLDGDTFAALLPTCGPEDAQRRADAIRTAIGDLRFHWDNRAFIISVSLGVLALDETQNSSRLALLAAERACRKAKDDGRNRVQLHTPDDPGPVRHPPGQRVA